MSVRATRVIVLSIAALSGCYLAHGPDDDAGRRDASVRPDVGSSCAAAGTYDTPARIVSVSPEGCIMDTPTTVPIRIPPRPEDFAAMCTGDVGVVGETAPCQWSIEAACAIPDASSSVSGTLEAHDGAVRGRLDVTQSGFGGECRFTVLLGD